MLNYLGPNLGPQGPVTSGMPPAVPGTMPDGVPGLAPTPSLAGPAPSPISPQGAPASPDALAAIMNRPPGAGSEAQEPPALPDYGVVTQEDGSILLHLKNPDGTLGPVVKVIPPVKRPEDSRQRPA